MRTRSALVGICLAVACSSAVAETVATPDNGILWQAVRNPASPIEWRWEGEDVTSARVTIASPMDGTTFAPIDVVRTDAALYGSVTLPGVRTAGREYLYDLTLELLAGDTVVQTQTARLVVLPDTAQVDAPAALGKRFVEGAALYSYNRRWDERATGDATVTVQGEQASADEVYTNESGYGFFSEKALADLGGLRPTATLSYATGAVAWSNCLRLHGGLILLFR